MKYKVIKAFIDKETRKVYQADGKTYYPNKNEERCAELVGKGHLKAEEPKKETKKTEAKEPKATK